MDWARHGVKIVHSDELDLNTERATAPGSSQSLQDPRLYNDLVARVGLDLRLNRQGQQETVTAAMAMFPNLFAFVVCIAHLLTIPNCP